MRSGLTTVHSEDQAPHAHSRGLAEVSPREAEAWCRAGGAIIVDVREPDEYARERIPGATLMPLATVSPAALAALARPGQRVVLHCRGGTRSVEALRRCEMLGESGRSAGSATSTGTASPEILSMRGGVSAWKEAGLPLEVDARVPRLSVMRQVQLAIGLLLIAGSALAWAVHPAFIAVPALLGAGLVWAGASGTCALATTLGRLPWNRTGGSCSSGTCAAVGVNQPRTGSSR